jgi:hypothetical protein
VPGAERRVVVWRAGEALLAVPLEDTIEIAAVDRDGRAAGRDGPLALEAPPGLPFPDPAPRAVIIRTAGRRVALAAESVEGVRTVHGEGTDPIPAWLGRLSADHIEGMIRIHGDRVAALLDVDALGDR